MSDNDERLTPREVFEPLDRIFTFNLDPCTTPDNPLATYRFYTKEWDGLRANWRSHLGNLFVTRAFVNPPYSNILGWAKKAVQEAERGAFVAFLLPNDCTTKAYQLICKESWGDWPIPFRVKFTTPNGKVVDTARGHIVFFLGGLE